MPDDFEQDDALRVIDLPRAEVLGRQIPVLSAQLVLGKQLARLKFARRVRNMSFNVLLMLLVAILLGILGHDPAARTLLLAVQPTAHVAQETLDFSDAAAACAPHLEVKGEPASFDGPMNQSVVRGTLQRLKIITCSGPNPFNPPPHPHHIR